jgi:hypothetical protein
MERHSVGRQKQIVVNNQNNTEMSNVRIHDQFKEMKSRNPKPARVLEIVLAVCIVLAVIWVVDNLPGYFRYFYEKFTN